MVVHRGVLLNTGCAQYAEQRGRSRTDPQVCPYYGITIFYLGPPPEPETVYYSMGFEMSHLTISTKKGTILKCLHNDMKSIPAHMKSRARVAQFGEVLTPPEIVNAMLDLVKQETERIDSRFLEPACGTGNFLMEILKRKLRIVEERYKKSQLEYERYAVLAVSSIYGIEILQDNVQECRENLFSIVDTAYTRLYKDKTKEAFRETVRYILAHNIVHDKEALMNALNHAAGAAHTGLTT